MTVTLTGSEALTKALSDLARAGDLGARDGIVAGGRRLVSITRGNMSGAPRWSRRGAGKTGAAVDTGRRPIHVARSGGPGVLTGGLRKNVHTLRPRRDTLGLGWTGKVSAMGGRGDGRYNLYAPKTEAAYPFLRPALVQFDRVAPAIFEAAWAARIGKV